MLADLRAHILPDGVGAAAATFNIKDDNATSEDYFSQKTDEELLSIQDSIDDCLRTAYLQLPRLDLAVVAVAAAMVARQLQARIDQVVSNDLKKRYNDVLAKTPQKSSNPRSVTVTISPLPNGLTRTLTIGSSQDICSAIDAMALECKKNVGPPLGYIFDTYLVAMIATPKPAPIFGVGSYLIGCRQSPNCSGLVPGDYDAEYVGTDGISISGIVPENKPNEPPVHEIFVIYHRGE
jgi:hypothetical protein